MVAAGGVESWCSMEGSRVALGGVLRKAGGRRWCSAEGVWVVGNAKGSFVVVLVVVVVVV